MTDECNICFEAINEAERTTLPCAHSFCFQCISTWKRINRFCPNCRSPISKKYHNQMRRQKRESDKLVARINQLVQLYESKSLELQRDKTYDFMQYQIYSRLSQK